MISLVLADDHPIVLAGLENMLRRERDCRVVASCVDGVEAMRAITRHSPDVAVLDLRMPRMDGLAVLRQIQKDKLATRTVLLAAVLVRADFCVLFFALIETSSGCRGLELRPGLIITPCHFLYR